MVDSLRSVSLASRFGHLRSRLSTPDFGSVFAKWRPNGGLEHGSYLSIYVFNILKRIIPTDELIFFSDG